MSLPIDSATKEWIDARTSWLVSEFGGSRLRNTTVVLPTTEFFPPKLFTTRDVLEDVFRFVCDLMEIDCQRGTA